MVEDKLTFHADDFLDSSLVPRYGTAMRAVQEQQNNQLEIGAVFDCPVWVDFGEQKIADIASFLIAKGLDSGIPIEIKLRLSLTCLYVPLTIFAISVFLSITFLGILCFYTKTRTIRPPLRRLGDTPPPVADRAAVVQRGSTTNGQPKQNGESIYMPTNFLRSAQNNEYTKRYRGKNDSKAYRSSLIEGDGPGKNRKPVHGAAKSAGQKKTAGQNPRPEDRIYPTKNPQIVREQTRGSLPSALFALA